MFLFGIPTSLTRSSSSPSPAFRVLRSSVGKMAPGTRSFEASTRTWGEVVASSIRWTLGAFFVAGLLVGLLFRELAVVAIDKFGDDPDVIDVKAKPA